MEELLKQLEIWIERNDPNLYEKDEKEYWKTMGSLTTLLIVKEWIEDNHTDIEDTPDIMDMGINELSISEE